MDGVNFATNDFDAMTEEQDSLTFMNAEGRDFENTLSHVILRLIGGIYEQNGVEDARRFIVKHILNKPIDISLVLESFDAKTDFYHLVTTGQYKPHPHSVIEYKAERVSGTDYYTVSLLCNGQVVTQVKAQTKAIGEQKAAQKALNEFYSTFSKRSTPIQNQMNSSV
jgi:dsRNA-specific ribonuclease